MKIDAKFVATVLKKRHDDSAWIFATEVSTSSGFDCQHSNGPGGIRRIDAFAMAIWPSKNFQRVAYEIKIARSDWLAEIETPMKRVQAWYLSNEFWFAVAENVMKPEDWREDMAGCGLLVIHKDGSVKNIRKARCRKHTFPMPSGFIVSLLRCVRDQDWKDSKMGY